MHSTTEPSADVCGLLEWDSDFWQCRIARVWRRTLDTSSAAAIDAWARRQDVSCLYFRCGAADQASRSAAEKAGYVLVDLPIEFVADIGSAEPPIAPTSVREAGPADQEALEVIAGTAFRHSRFYVDKNFPDQGCDRLFVSWAGRSLASEAETVLVVGDQAAPPRAFLTLGAHDRVAGRIGLVAVSPTYQGRGYGKRLVAAARNRAEAAGWTALRVTTQATNLAAIALYEGAGFRVHAEDAWYHKWLKQNPGADRASGNFVHLEPGAGND